jgi:hypothetical protein
LTRNKDYEVQLNRCVNGTKQRPDISCTINGVPFLVSEIKPLGCGPLQKTKDFIKTHLRARKAINQQLNSKGGPGKAAMLLNYGLFLL